MRFAEDKILNEKLIPFYNTEKGKEVFNHFYTVNVRLRSALLQLE